MCNINVYLRKKLLKENNRDTVERYAYACAHSYISNSDMEGLYVSHTNKIHASEYKISLNKYWRSLCKSHVIIDHTRISTSGRGFENCQPFTDGRYVFCHNGILTLAGKHDLNKKSDSKVYFDELSNNLIAESVIDAIKKTHKEIARYGSYSMALFDTVAQKLYYWKNLSTSMIMLENDDSIILSTNSQNDYLFPSHKMTKVKDGVLITFEWINNSLVISNVSLDIATSFYGGASKAWGYGYDYDYYGDNRKSASSSCEQPATRGQLSKRCGYDGETWTNPSQSCQHYVGEYPQYNKCYSCDLWGGQGLRTDKKSWCKKFNDKTNASDVCGYFDTWTTGAKEMCANCIHFTVMPAINVE